MTASKQEKTIGNSRSTTTSNSEVQSGPKRVNESTFFRFEQATKKLFRSTIKDKDRTVHNAAPVVQLGPGEQLFPQDDRPWVHIFPQNVAAPSSLVSLPPADARLETTAQLAYYNHLLQTHLSPSSTTASIKPSLDFAQQASVDAIFQDKEEQSRICEMTARLIEEFSADSLKTSDNIAEVVLLGPVLDKEYYRKLLNCFITDFEAATLLDIDLLQGIVQLVECSGPEYLLPDDLVRILAILRNRLQDTHQQWTKHPYYLTLALSRLMDVIVEGKVRDLNRVVYHEPLSALLKQLAENPDPYLKHQVAYALQALLHVPNDETCRQSMLRRAGRITLGLLGVASVCKLDLSEFKDGVDHLYKAAGEAHEVATQIVGGAQELLESGHDIVASVKGGVLSGGRRLWYSALREAQENIGKGRLADFNRLVFEAPCCQDVEFQWGVCKLLGEMTADQHWEVATRQQAVDFLAKLYRNEASWTPKEEVGIWILHILRQVIALPDPVISGHALSTIRGLEKEGDSAKRALYREVMAGPLIPYPMAARLPVPSTSPLLARVLAVPSVEYDLHKLRAQRLKERENALYIPLLAKPTLQSSDDTLFSLMEKALEFLAGSGIVLLVMGDSGGGKSTFNLQLEHTLWQNYRRGGPIPLHINLPGIDNPQQNMIEKQLRYLNFSDAQIQELKLHRQFVVICDGYDESQLRKNLYTTNQLNKPRQWKIKMVIGCRTQYLGSDYRSQFQPTVDRYAQPPVDLFQEAVLAPFSRTQIEQYVKQYVERAPSQVANPDQLEWDVEDYMDKLLKIPHLIELVSNPFLLTLALRALPRMAFSKQELSEIRLTRVGLYDSFTEEWLDNNKRRLEDCALSLEGQSTFDILREEGFVQQGISFQKELAAAIFQHQDGNPVVEYSHLRERHTWKGSFFSPDTQITLMREASPLARSGNQFRFLHRSILEYLYSRVMSDPCDPQSNPIESLVEHPLNQRSIVREPSIVQFLSERVELDPSFKARLFDAVEESKLDVQVSQAAANAISILVRAGVRFNGADLRGIRIPGADVRGGQFDSANLGGADMSNVNLGKTWLRQADLSRTQMAGVQFGELPDLRMKDWVCCCVFSPDGDILAVSTRAYEITIFDTATWTGITTYPGGIAIAVSPTARELTKSIQQSNTVEIGDILTGEVRLIISGHEDDIVFISYSADGSLLATTSKDTTIRVCSALSGDILHVLRGHSASVTGVAFSPTGAQLASCSKDGTIRTWNVQTGESTAVLNGHFGYIYAMAFSPNGCQIAFGDSSGDIVLWDPHTGEFTDCLVGHSGDVYSLTYSPDGQMIASGGLDRTIRLWSSQNGEMLGELSGHLHGINFIAYSPTGDYIASGSSEGTVRLWKYTDDVLGEPVDSKASEWHCMGLSPNGDRIITSGLGGRLQVWEALTGKLMVTLSGDRGTIQAAIYSPCGERIASVDSDKTARLWCARTGELLDVIECLTGHALTVAFPPDGLRIVSVGRDRTIRTQGAHTSVLKLDLYGHFDEVVDVAYSPGGDQIASCSEDRTARMWCARTGQQLFILDHPESVNQVVYSPDGKELVSVSMFDGILRRWDTKSGKLIGMLKRTDVKLVCCCFSTDGSLIATSDRDGMLRLWDQTSGAFVQVFQAVVGLTLSIQWKQITENVHYLATLDMGTLRIWELVAREEIFHLRLLWSHGKKELSFEDAILCGAVGLSPADFELVKQRGAITEYRDESEPTSCVVQEE